MFYGNVVERFVKTEVSSADWAPAAWHRAFHNTHDLRQTRHRKNPLRYLCVDVRATAPPLDRKAHLAQA